MRVANVIFDSLSPLGGLGGGALQFVAPTVLDTPIQIASNTSAFGTQIYPEPAGAWDTRQPYEMAWKNTPEMYKNAGKFLHNMLGGDEYQHRLANSLGISDLTNPEVIQHLAQTFGGGITSMVERSLNLTEKGSLNDVVGLRRFIKEPQADADFNAKWFPMRDMMGEHVRRVESLDGADLARYLTSNPEARLSAEFASLEKTLDKYGKLAKKAKPEQARAIEDRMRDMQLEFLRKYNDATF
jgi:hypothetical protein